MTEETWNKSSMKAAFTLELERARDYLKEKERITPKPEPYKKVTTLHDDEEKTLLSKINIKKEVIEIISNFKVTSWTADIERLTLELNRLELELEKHLIKDSEV